MNKMKENSKEKSNGGKNRKAIFVLCLVVLVICICWLVAYFIGLRQAEEEMNRLQDEYTQTIVTPVPVIMNTATPAPTPTETPTPTPEPTEEPVVGKVYPGLEEYDVPEKIIDFAGLLEQENEHIYSWIYIPDTKVDYPVVQHPEELNYYLDYNLNGVKGYPGGIYTQYLNSKDWTDPNTVIYGHNMGNGTAFGGLRKYRDSQYFEEHPYIYIYTPEEILVYKIFAAYEFTDQHLLFCFDFGNDESFQEYLDGIRETEGWSNNFDKTIELTAEDRILTLSTCIDGKPNNRFLVQGVLVAKGDNQD